MDAFEEIAFKLLLEDNYWVRHSVKVNLTKEEKVNIHKPTTPRPEIDLVAYRPKENELLLIEVKSYLDSNGVRMDELLKEYAIQKGKYKLLTSANYREIISTRLKKDWMKSGLIDRNTRITYGLIAGKVFMNKEDKMQQYFNERNWFFWGPSEVRSRLEKLMNNRYENNQATVMSKILMR